MRALQRSFLALCLIGLTMSKIIQSEAPHPIEAISHSANQFSVDFFKKIVAEHQGNLICSPLSVNVALTMTAIGASGSTKEQFTDVLHLPSIADTLDGNKAFINCLNDVDNVTLKLGNKIFIADGFEVKASYKRDLQTYFRSDIESVDFINKEKALETINSWVKDRTNNRIDSIVQPEDLNPAPALILANAVYFKGNWAYQFDVEQTKDRPFHIDESTTKDVPTMYQKGYFKYADLPDYDAKCIQLPYADKRINMVIILPNQINGLSRISEEMNKAFQHCIERLNSTYYRDVHVFLPKFKIESKLNLENTLSNKMGLSEPFSDHANFSGISSLPLKISKVVQKAFIEVNEEGSEAAAVTGIHVLGGRPAPPNLPILFNVDRPFYYDIRYKTMPLFIGSIVKPSAEIQFTLFSSISISPEEEFIVDHPFLYSIIKSDRNHETENKDVTLFVGRIVDPIV